ncbi:MAG: sugar phosphate isomerase/epimerase family protein [Bryobacteraceae bacterium]
MTFTRRDLGKLAVAALPAASLPAKPDSRFKGVQIGAITYSFRQLPGAAADILKYCVDLGISSIELMGDVAESYAGAPGTPRRGGRAPLTPEQQEAMRKAAGERKQWRLSVPMDKYKALRAMYNAAGVSIDIFKLPPAANMSDDEYEYIFSATKALGANCITMELPADGALTKRVGEFADKHKIHIGYHNHTQVNEHSWDTALAQSKYNTINLDVGHFTEAISASPVPFMKKYHERITSFHLKDKKYKSHGGGNTVWGQGDTPLKEILQLMAKEKYKWPANIELEYEIPESSNVIAEMAKCVKFCKDALS